MNDGSHSGAARMNDVTASLMRSRPQLHHSVASSHLRRYSVASSQGARPWHLPRIAHRDETVKGGAGKYRQAIKGVRCGEVAEPEHAAVLPAEKAVVPTGDILQCEPLHRHAITPLRGHAVTTSRRYAVTPLRRHAATPLRRYAATPLRVAWIVKKKVIQTVTSVTSVTSPGS